MSTTPEQPTNARYRIAVAAGLALLCAVLILVAFVLPAEYGVDPLGTGARLGLLELGLTGQRVRALEEAAAAGAGQAAIIVPQQRRLQQETVTFELEPFEGMEYKYRLEKGEALLYSWKASTPVAFDFHAEPDGAPSGYAQTYEEGKARADASGTLTAPFPGIHGWFWENPTDQVMSVTLTTAGFYTLSNEYRRLSPVKTKTFQ